MIYIFSTRTRTNFEPEATLTERHSIMDEIDECNSYEYLENDHDGDLHENFPLASTSTTTILENNTNSRKKRKNNEPDLLNEKFVSTLEIFQNHIKNQSEPKTSINSGNNQDLCFGQTIASIIVDFPDKYKAIAKLEILKYLTTIQKEITDDENLNNKF